MILEQAPAAGESMLPDEQITAERSEIKYLVPSQLLHTLVAAIDQHISPHRYRGEGANQLPFPQHFITTVYLDTPTRAHYRAALHNLERDVKVRVREYYDVHPSLAELATSGEQILHHQPWIWLEVKRRENNRTIKRRARLPKREVPKLFPGGTQLTHELVSWETKGESSLALREIAEYCLSIGETLAPSCAVNYQRLSWQQPDAKLRLTLDLDLSFFNPDASLWLREQTLVKEILGAECGRANYGVFELKHRGELPEWLEKSLESMSLQPSRHSKFLLASRAANGT